MRVRYDKTEDILMIEIAKKKIDDSYESENMIVHVAKNREPVLLEIFKASEFFRNVGRSLPKLKTSSVHQV